MPSFCISGETLKSNLRRYPISCLNSVSHMCIYYCGFLHFKVFVQSIAKTLGKLSKHEVNTNDVDLILSLVHRGLTVLFRISWSSRNTY